MLLTHHFSLCVQAIFFIQYFPVFTTSVRIDQIETSLGKLEPLTGKLFTFLNLYFCGKRAFRNTFEI